MGVIDHRPEAERWSQNPRLWRENRLILLSPCLNELREFSNEGSFFWVDNVSV